jgi:hypothetical protein
MGGVCKIGRSTDLRAALRAAIAEAAQQGDAEVTDALSRILAKIALPTMGTKRTEDRAL